MRSPLHSRIAALRNRVRRQLALHGLSLVVAGLAAFVLVAGLADWSIHLVREIRVALLVGFLGLTAYLVARYVVAPLIVRFRDLDIALKIERRWPGLNDRLASTVQFLDMEKAGEGDRSDVLGSRALREATIQQTLAETDAIDFREVVDARPARRASLVATGAVAAGLAVFASDPKLGEIALRRLFLPMASNPWPKQTHLEIVRAPTKVARGEPFALEVGVAKGERAPGSARVTYRYEGGEIVTESLRPDSKNRFHGRKESTDKSFTFTVASGDDATAPRAVAVVPPPVVTEASVRLEFPAYTALPPRRLASAKDQIQAVLGTTVTIEAAANKPIASAILARGEGQAPIAAEVDAARRKITAKFTLAESGPVTFVLRDTEGFQSQEKDAVRFDLRAVKDEAPKVVIDEPASDRDVTANADVPVEITADDDFGLGVVRLVYTASANGSEPSREVIVPLWATKGGTAAPTKQKTVTYLWQLEPLKLAPGSLLTFHADARDLDNLRGPNLGKSRELHLRIVTPEQIAVQLEEQRRALREEIDRALGMQKQAMTPVQDALRTLSRTDALDAPKREDVKNAETIQRQLSGRITSKSDGLEQKLRKYLEDLANLKIDTPDAKAQMENLLRGTETIRDNHLGPAEQGLTRASKELDQQAADAGRNPDGTPKAEETPKGTDGPQPGETEKSAAAKGQEKAAASKGETSKAGQAKSGQDKAGAEKAGQAKSGESKAGENADAKAGESPKQSQSPSSSKPSGKTPAGEALAQAEKNQKAIADELQKMRDSLGEFETYRGVIQDAKKLLKEHEDAMKAAAEAANKPDMTAKAAEALTPEQKADLANVAARQAEVAKSLAGLENKMDEMANRLDASEPMSAAALREAAGQSRQRGTAGKMDEAAAGIEKNQMGAAQSGQKQAQQDLKKLVDALQNRKEHELARLVKELKAAEKDMKALRDKQAENRDKTGKAKGMPEGQEKKDELQKLSKEQKQLQEELKKQLLKLSKLRADAAAQAGAKAQGKMAQAGQDQEEGDAEDAEKQQEEALANLDEAQDEIEQARKDAEEQLAMEQLSKIKDNLQALAERQDKAAEETAAYDEARASKGLTLAQRAGVRTLARVQDSLKDEAAELTERLDAAPAFALNLKKAADRMDEAGRLLQSLKTDAPTQKAEQTASKRIKQLLDALKPDPPQGGGEQQQGGGGGGGGKGGGGDGIGLASQLKVLKMLQEEVNERTEAIDEIKVRKKTLTPEQQGELDGLTADQHTIADIARDLTKPKKSDGEE